MKGDTAELVGRFLSDFIGWASTREAIRAVALVGSRARGTASADSDVDLVILVDSPGDYLEDTGWTGRFGSVEKSRIES